MGGLTSILKRDFQFQFFFSSNIIIPQVKRLKLLVKDNCVAAFVFNFDSSFHHISDLQWERHQSQLENISSILVKGDLGILLIINWILNFNPIDNLIVVLASKVLIRFCRIGHTCARPRGHLGLIEPEIEPWHVPRGIKL